MATLKPASLKWVPRSFQLAWPRAGKRAAPPRASFQGLPRSRSYRSQRRRLRRRRCWNHLDTPRIPSSGQSPKSGKARHSLLFSPTGNEVAVNGLGSVPPAGRPEFRTPVTKSHLALLGKAARRSMNGSTDIVTGTISRRSTRYQKGQLIKRYGSWLVQRLEPEPSRGARLARRTSPKPACST